MIDTHIHLLEPDRFTYPWTESFPALTGRFDLSDYLEASAGCGITAGVFMEVDCGEPSQEAARFCALAEEPGCLIRSVVASARPESPDFECDLDGISHPRLVGIRRVLHVQPDDLSRSALFRRHVALLGKRGLSFDLCVLERQLPVALALASACPGTTMILDHCGCPDIAGHAEPGRFEGWRREVAALAALPNVMLKFSGISAYAPAGLRDAASLRPYFDEVLGAFGPGRIVWGGDWPVVNLGDGLAAWVSTTSTLVETLSPSEQKAILEGNARRIYRI